MLVGRKHSGQRRRRKSSEPLSHRLSQAGNFCFGHRPATAPEPLSCQRKRNRLHRPKPMWVHLLPFLPKQIVLRTFVEETSYLVHAMQQRVSAQKIAQDVQGTES